MCSDRSIESYKRVLLCCDWSIPAADCDDHPGHQETMVSQLGSEYQHEAADEAKEGIKDSVLDDGAHANILAAVLVVPVDGVAVADDVEDGGNHGQEDLHNADDDDGPLE